MKIVWIISLALIGAISGFFCAVLLLWFGFVIGTVHSSEHFYWIFASLIGIPVGAVTLPVGYLALLHRIPFLKAWYISVTGTLMAGCAGMFIGDTAGLLSAMAGFGLVCFYFEEHDDSSIDAPE